MQSKCGFVACLVSDDEELDVASCTSCTKPVHHMRSNTIHEGGLDVRVCSHGCHDALELQKQPSKSEAVPASHAAPNKRLRGHKGAQPKSKSSAKVKRKHKSENQSQSTAKTTRSNKKNTIKRGARTSNDGGTFGNNAAAASASVSTKNARPNADKRINKIHKGSSTQKLYGTKSLTVENEQNKKSSLPKRCSDNDMESSEDEQGGSDIGSDGECHVPDTKPTKFYFSPARDLLTEIINIQQYAAEHGSVTDCYDDVTVNLNEH
ncbi:hypothetical protein PR003_g1254 [Phytophthora rubi]|uniref:Uncharacterized protein n=1 Tax=Phytophthora rubi TaxID=129364 RepID=A0A6A3JWP9_9STRA|nr:hypothetical protein PR002_g18808 [Phytophthora rubi]KAE9001953.1 hypothetical protein PR001_g18384 [Phytophthora rubi]KAE9358455.1 hypothetical protein PR003_g1254 [Phytophthora rubi]